MTIVLTPSSSSSMRQLSTSGARGNAPRPVVGDWIVSVTQQNVMSLEEACEVHSLETLRTSISDGLRAISNAWNEIENMVKVDADDVPLSKEFAPINDLVERVSAASRHYGDGLVTIEPLIGSLENAIARIYRSRQAPWGSWRSIGSQKTLPACDGLTPNATAAFTVFYHLEHAVNDILATLLAVRCVEARSAPIPFEPLQYSNDTATVDLPKDEDLIKAQQFAVATRRAGRALDKMRPIIDNALLQASGAMPPERRRWKIRIAILVGLFMLSATLIVATILLPQMFPALVIIGVALKIASGLLSGLSLVNSVFTLVAYPLNRGWADMSRCIEKVRNLYGSMNLRIREQQEAVCEREEEILRRRISDCGTQIRLAAGKHNDIMRKLNNLNDVMTASL
ncbi:hypothetical protein PAN31117_02248 [Pandoraea anapnoica]|uniref:Transmembrane protein n=1 Tax=Pandoraea anapnoica TaxID=2508301 RepID=A0A5E4ZY56_9BURK|nr:hypothetical protein [Pandoraea anapnoica]VVE66309.1 hypothetical protein PAN31117_02248 [Pandoraea anapnoica]